MNNEDRRVKKTENVLQNALAKLLINKKIQNITIKELTNTADIHRSTFYTHYQDIYSLYEQIENSVIEELNIIISNDPTHSYEALYVTLIDYVYDNAILYRMLISNNGNINLQKRVKQLIEDNYLKIWQYEDNKSSISEEMRYFTTYHVQGCMSVLNLWVESNFTYSKENILDMLRKLNNHIEKIMP